MSEKDVLEEYTGSLEELFFKDSKWTFLVGAGTSMDAPSNLPSARQISRTILEFCAPEEELENLLSLEMLRYELLVESIQDMFDTELVFMDYFDEVKEPNLIHLFLASAISKNNFAVTTNFDYLIERALMRVLSEDQHHQIIPIITKDDFLEHQEPQVLVDSGKHPLYKIHGSKTNIITSEGTIDSLITTISDLGKDRESGETFAIEPYKKPAVNNLMKDQSLMVMGYSGSDDFDIGPVLKELPSLKTLIWIEHVLDDEVSVFKIEKVEDLSVLDKLSKPESLLAEIRSDVDFEVYLVRANTGNFLQKHVWKQILANSPIILPKSEEDAIKPPDFREWARSIYEHTKPISKYQLAGKIFLELNQYNAVVRCAEKGLKLCKGEDEESVQDASTFYNHLGRAYQELGKFDIAMEYYEKSLKIAEDSGDNDSVVANLSGIGYNYYTRGDFKKALEHFTRAYKISEEENLPKHCVTKSRRRRHAQW